MKRVCVGSDLYGHLTPFTFNVFIDLGTLTAHSCFKWQWIPYCGGCGVHAPCISCSYDLLFLWSSICSRKDLRNFYSIVSVLLFLFKSFLFNNTMSPNSKVPKYAGRRTFLKFILKRLYRHPVKIYHVFCLNYSM